MSYNDTQLWIKEAAKTYLGNMSEFMHQLSLKATGEDLTHLAMEAADFVKELAEASADDRAIARGFATAFGRPLPGTQNYYTFGGAMYLKKLSEIIAHSLPPNYRKATQFNEEMLKTVLQIQSSDDEKIIMLDFLGVSRSNAIVANAEIYRYHPEMALEDPMETGAWLK